MFLQIVLAFETDQTGYESFPSAFIIPDYWSLDTAPAIGAAQTANFDEYRGLPTVIGCAPSGDAGTGGRGHARRKLRFHLTLFLPGLSWPRHHEANWHSIWRARGPAA